MQPKTGRNRLHVDLAPPPTAITTEADRLVSLGARRIHIGRGDADWAVLSDPDDNEF